MTTSRAITAPPHDRTHTDSDLATIADLVMWHLIPSLSVRSLIQLNCPTWNMWDPATVDRIAQARTHDDTRDWYFPVIIKRVERWSRGKYKHSDWDGNQIKVRDVIQSNVPKLSWSWSGIFHSDATPHSVSNTALPLPPLTHLPNEWERLSLPGDDIIASAGGLLLIKSVQGTVPARRSSRLSMHLTLIANGSGHLIGRRHNWKRLLVCNPLTRKCRELPDASYAEGGWTSCWNYAYRNGVQAAMVVDEQSNCYQVVLTFESFAVVYKSTTNAWRCLRFPAPRAWAKVEREDQIRQEWDCLMCWSYHCASVHTRGGRLLFAGIHSYGVVHAGIRTAANAMLVGDLQLFEVDTEAGTWEVVHEYPLQKFHAPFLNRSAHPRSYDMNIHTFIELVECMDNLYIVYPAKLHDVFMIGQVQLYDEAFDPEAIGEYMPLAFYIMRLQGDGTNNGVLRIQVPQTTDGFQTRCAKLHLMACDQQPFYSEFFKCNASGSTIWVSILDYVLSYNVMSQETTTKIIPLDDESEVEPLRFAYRPSLHMRP